MRIRVGAESRFDFRHRLRMSCERHAQRRRGRLPCVVVGCGADAPKAEHQVVVRERIAQQRSEAIPVVTEIVDKIRRQASRRQRFDHVRQVLVLPFARQDLVTDDQRANVHQELSLDKMPPGADASFRVLRQE